MRPRGSKKKFCLSAPPTLNVRIASAAEFVAAFGGEVMTPWLPSAFDAPSAPPATSFSPLILTTAATGVFAKRFAQLVGGARGAGAASDAACVCCSVAFSGIGWAAAASVSCEGLALATSKLFGCACSRTCSWADSEAAGRPCGSLGNDTALLFLSIRWRDLRRRVVRMGKSRSARESQGSCSSLV